MVNGEECFCSIAKVYRVLRTNITGTIAHFGIRKTPAAFGMARGDGELLGLQYSFGENPYIHCAKLKSEVKNILFMLNQNPLFNRKERDLKEFTFDLVRLYHPKRTKTAEKIEELPVYPVKPLTKNQKQKKRRKNKMKGGPVEDGNSINFYRPTKLGAFPETGRGI